MRLVAVAPVGPAGPLGPVTPVAPVGPVTVDVGPVGPVTVDVGPVGPIGPPLGPVGPVIWLTLAISQAMMLTGSPPKADCVSTTVLPSVATYSLVGTSSNPL